MKTPLHILNLQHLLSACLTLAAGVCIAAAAADTPAPDNSSALLRLQEQLDQQTKRIDRLYNALGPHLEEMEERAAEVEKQAREDKALAMERIREVEDADGSILIADE